jgi:hypothetical protein
MDTPNAALTALFTVDTASVEIDLRATESNVLVVCRDSGDNTTHDNSHDNLEQNSFVLLPWDKKLMSGSPVCRKLAKTITKSQIMVPGAEKFVMGLELLHDENVIICFPDAKEYFMQGYIETIGDFYEYIKFADRYMLNIPYICSMTDRMIWLLSIKERQKDLWRQNSIFLDQIETTPFLKPKFGVPAVVAAGNGPYPVRDTKPTAKFVAINEIKTPDFLPVEDFIVLIDLLLTSSAHDFVSKMIAVLGPSIEYYPVIFGNEDVVNRLKLLPCFFQSMFYAFRIMWLEELAMWDRKRGPGRFIMDIDTVGAYPDFDSISKPDSPYFGLVLSHMPYDTGLTLPASIPGDRGVYSTEEFKSRLAIFSSNALKHIEWSGDNYKTALTGSSITACAVKTPLEALFRDIEDYFNEYYPGRRVVRNVTKKPTTHLDITQDAMFSMIDSGSSSSSEDSAESEDTEDNKNDSKTAENTTGVIHAIDYTDLDLMVACKWDDFDAIADKHYHAIKMVFPAAEMTLVKTENKHKYIVSGMPRDVDIFHVDCIESVLVKYHLGCVRAFYDGSRVKCFPSFITAAKLGLNTDIRWTSNRKDVRDIVMKYFQRGFGTILNGKDRQNLVDYVNNSTQWPHIGPGAGQNWWRTRRYWREPLFHDKIALIFNPSRSKIGIHNHINAKICIIDTGKIKCERARGKVYGRRPKRRAGGAIKISAIRAVQIDDINDTDVDYKSNGLVLLPNTCPTLSAYL